MASRIASTQAPTTRTAFITPPTSAGNPSQAHSNAPPTAAMSPDLEQKLALLSSHRSVLGYLLIARGHQASIIRHSGVVFEGEQGRKYAAVVARIVASVQAGLDELRRDDAVNVAGTEPESDEIRFMRIRTKRHELMISPDDRYLLAVLHDPAT